MEKKLHITLAGQRDLSCVSTAFPYLDLSVTKACSICSKKAKKIITGIFLLHFQFTGYLLRGGQGGGQERGWRTGSARKEIPSFSFAVSIHFSLSAQYCSFLDLCKILQT